MHFFFREWRISRQRIWGRLRQKPPHPNPLCRLWNQPSEEKKRNDDKEERFGVFELMLKQITSDVTTQIFPTPGLEESLSKVLSKFLSRFWAKQKQKRIMFPFCCVSAVEPTTDRKVSTHPSQILSCWFIIGENQENKKKPEHSQPTQQACPLTLCPHSLCVHSLCPVVYVRHLKFPIEYVLSSSCS